MLFAFGKKSEFSNLVLFSIREGVKLGTSLSFTFLKIDALVTPAVYRVPTLQKIYDENGVHVEKEQTDKRAKPFLDEFFWCVEAQKRKEGQ